MNGRPLLQDLYKAGHNGLYSITMAFFPPEQEFHSPPYLMLCQSENRITEMFLPL